MIKNVKKQCVCVLLKYYIAEEIYNWPYNDVPLTSQIVSVLYLCVCIAKNTTNMHKHSHQITFCMLLQFGCAEHKISTVAHMHAHSVIF